MSPVRTLLSSAVVGFFLCACGTGLQLTEVQSSSNSPSNVAVYFKVETSQGEPVPGLSAEQFNIYEDESLVSVYESKQTILNPEVAASHYTLLLVDMSGSVSESEDAQMVVEAAQVFASKVEKNNKLAIYAFDGEEKIHPITRFTGSAGGAQARTNSLSSFRSSDPSTNLHGAVVQGLEVLEKDLEDAENPLRFGTLVVFTDGTDRASRVSRDEMLESVNNTPHAVFAIGLGAEMSEDELNKIGKDGTAMAQDRKAVVDAFDSIAQRIEGMTRSYYLLSYCSPARAGEHDVRIEAIAKDPQTGKERRGSLTSRFDAQGFKKGCDPSTPPKFDVRKGDLLREEDQGPSSGPGKGKGTRSKNKDDTGGNTQMGPGPG